MSRKRTPFKDRVDTQHIIQLTIVSLLKKEGSVTPKELSEEVEEINEEIAQISEEVVVDEN